MSDHFELDAPVAKVTAYPAEQDGYLLGLYSAQWPGDVSSLLNEEQTRALFRYLAGIVLPEVEREERVSRISVFRSPLSPHFEVARVTNHVRLGRTGMSAGDARALAACLLAAADEAEGGHQ